MRLHTYAENPWSKKQPNQNSLKLVSSALVCKPAIFPMKRVNTSVTDRLSQTNCSDVLLDKALCVNKVVRLFGPLLLFRRGSLSEIVAPHDDGLGRDPNSLLFD